MADEPEVTVSVTPSDRESPDGGPSETTAVAAGHAEGVAEAAAQDAAEAEVNAEIALNVADSASQTAFDTQERLANLEQLVTGLAAQQTATNDAIAQIAQLVQAQAALALEEKKPDPEPVKPDTTPNPGGWYHRKLFRK